MRRPPHDLRALVKNESAFELVALSGGVCTLLSVEHRETFHPVIGPVAEARAIHIAPQRLEERIGHCDSAFVIWDVGLGAAANAICALEELRTITAPAMVELHSFDTTLEPLEFALEHAAALSYLVGWEATLRQLAEPGGVTLQLGRAEVFWRLHLGDFTAKNLSDVAPPPHAVFYDPYSPASNPAMWSLEQFTRLADALTAPCLVSCYSRSTSVRVTLLLAGFFVGIGAATGEKEETTVAANELDLLARPLPAAWLEKVRRSTHSAPRGTLDSASGRISASDFARLEAHPQFRG